MMFTKITIAAAVASSQPSLIFGQQEISNLDTCVKEFNPDQDLFPSKWILPVIKTYGEVDLFGAKFEPSVTTELLDITYHNTYKIIHNKFVNATYLLYQCGTEPPTEEVQSGKHKLVIEVPHKGGLALTSTVQIPALELLGLRREIKAYIGETEWVSSPCINYMLEQGDIEKIDENSVIAHGESASASVADFLERNPEGIILGGPFDNVDAPRTMIVTDSHEKTNVGQFDWIGFYSALYNKEDMSNRISSSAQQNFDCASENSLLLSSTPTERKLKEASSRKVSEEEDNRPTLLWANWFEGFGWSVAECPNYQAARECEWATSCNSKILSRTEGVGTDIDGYIYLNDDEFFEFGKDADVWVYASQFWDNVYEQKAEFLQQFKAYKNQKIFDTQGVSPNSWFEQRLAEYYVVGMDVCAVMGVDGGVHKSRWLRNIFTEKVGELPECNVAEIDEPYVAPVSDCAPIAATLNVVKGNDNASTISSAVQGLVLIPSLVFAASLL